MEENGTITINVSQDRVALYNPIEAGIADLAEKYKDGPKDLSIPANYEECRKALAETRGIRGKTEKLRKELKADALAYGRLVDSTAKGIIEQVQKIEEPYAAAKKEYDTRVEIEKREKALAEERRVDGISARIATISAMVAAHVSSSSTDIAAIMVTLETDLATCDEWAMEFTDKARTATTEALDKLKEIHTMRVQQEQAEAERIRVERERHAQAEAERVQREKEAAEERERLAKERAALEEERKKQEAAMQAERDRIAKIQAEQEAAMQAERNRIAKIQAEQEAAIKAMKEEKERAAAEEAARVKAEEDKKAAEEAAKKKAAEDVARKEESRGSAKDCNKEDYKTADYKAAGRAIMAITGDRQTAKTLLDSIINGSIPHIQFTGAVS